MWVKSPAMNKEEGEMSFGETRVTATSSLRRNFSEIRGYSSLTTATHRRGRIGIREENFRDLKFCLPASKLRFKGVPGWLSWISV